MLAHFMLNPRTTSGLGEFLPVISGWYLPDPTGHFQSLKVRRPLGLGKDDLPRRAVSALTGPAKDYLKLRRHLSALKREVEGLPFGTMFDHLMGDPFFVTGQKKSEIVPLLNLVAENQPKYICEIGSALGGTLFLLAASARPDALIVSIDLQMPIARSKTYEHFPRGSQRLHQIRGNSQSPAVTRRLLYLLGGQRLDFLFIDGDHSYEGVKHDFEVFSPLVRVGGLIAFHDIVPDYHTRYGTDTGNYAGGVPQFWATLKENYRHWEFIEDPEQDGFGIGLLEI